MEDNNKLENNTNGSTYGSALYSADPQTEGTEPLSVYGQPQQAKEAEPASVPRQPQSVQEAESVPTPEQPQEPAASVSLEKPTESEQLQAGQSYQSMGSQSASGAQQGFYGQPLPGNQQDPGAFNASQPVFPNQPDGYQPDYNGQPMRGNSVNGNPVNGNQQGGYQTNYNGQPMNPGYPMNGYQPNYNGQQVPPYAQPKKRKTGLVIGIAAAAVIVVTAAAGVLFSKSLFGGGAKQQLAKGMMNMSKEMAAYSSSIYQDIDIAALRKLAAEKPMHTNIDLSFTDPNTSGSFDNVSVEIDAISDARNKQGKYDVNVGTYGFDMELGSIVADSNTLYFSSPLIFKDDVYSLDLTNLGKDFNNSAWAELFETTIPEDSSYTLFADENDSAETGAADALELGKIIGKYSKGTKDACTYAVIKEKREFPYGGALTAFGGVQATVDKDAVNASMESIKNDILSSEFYANYLEQYKTVYGSEFDEYKKEFDNAIEQIFGLRYEQDPVLNFYLDKKGRIINISTPEDIAVSSKYADIESIAVDIDFGGDERALDAIEGGIYMQTGEEILYLGVSRTAYVTEDFYSEDLTIRLQSDSSKDDITFYYGNDWGYADKSYDMTISIEASGETIALTAEGSFEDVVKGEGYTLRVNNAALTMDDEDLLLMSGVISMEPAGSDKIAVPENAIDMLKMSRQDIMGAIYNAAYSLQ
ncbi:MAG: hypothetical protein K2N73_12175 [Lachnospiraceae bacterium]|nr:hypothetical protein [Lachnospiraceae bacterium]